MAETPIAPKNPWDEGAEASSDAQKAALAKVLAEQGSLGVQSIQNRSQDANAISAQAQAQFGVGGGAPYQTFQRDAEQARIAQEQHMARIGAANNAYMDQVKGAIPLQRGDTEAMYGAMRLEYEERQREREAEEARRAQAAADARRSSSSSSSNALLKALEKRAVDRELAAQDFADLNAGQKTPSLAKGAGAAGGMRDILQAAKDLGMDVNAAKRRWVDNDPKNRFAAQDKALKAQIEIEMQEALANDVPWAQVISGTKLMAQDMGLDWTANIQPWLAMYSPLWGVADSEWATSIPKGPGYGYQSPTKNTSTKKKPSQPMYQNPANTKPPKKK